MNVRIDRERQSPDWRSWVRYKWTEVANREIGVP
jgi:hypothetical protein